MSFPRCILALTTAAALTVPALAYADLAPAQPPVFPGTTAPAPRPRPAQPPPGKSTRAAVKADAKNAKRDELRARLKAVRAARIVEALQLDEQSAARLFAVFGKYDGQLEPLRAEAAATRTELAQIVRTGKADAAQVNPRLDKLMALRGKQAAIEAQLMTEARAILTPLQAAKLVLVLPEIDRQLERGIRRRLNGNGGDMDDDAAGPKSPPATPRPGADPWRGRGGKRGGQPHPGGPGGAAGIE